MKINSQEDEKRSPKNLMKKHFFRSKSPKDKNKTKTKDKKDTKESTGNLLAKRSVTGTTTNLITSNDICKGKNQELSKKKRKKDVFSIYSPMTVDDQLEATKTKK